jgi:hypothetical protein
MGEAALSHKGLVKVDMKKLVFLFLVIANGLFCGSTSVIGGELDGFQTPTQEKRYSLPSSVASSPERPIRLLVAHGEVTESGRRFMTRGLPCIPLMGQIESVFAKDTRIMWQRSNGRFQLLIFPRSIAPEVEAEDSLFLNADLNVLCEELNEQLARLPFFKDIYFETLVYTSDLDTYKDCALGLLHWMSTKSHSRNESPNSLPVRIFLPYLTELGTSPSEAIAEAIQTFGDLQAKVADIEARRVEAGFLDLFAPSPIH